MKFSAIALLFLLAGCGSSGTGNGTGTVNASTTYSTSSVVGTYSVVLSGYFNGDYTKYVGSFIADGNGNITSGSLTEYGLNQNISGSCTASFSGQYSIQSNAAGTATVTFSPSGTNGCTNTGTMTYALQAAQQGQALLFAESDGVIGLLSGTAEKQ